MQELKKLSRTEMKNVLGGVAMATFNCYVLGANGKPVGNHIVQLTADNANDAQTQADKIAEDPRYSSDYPYGIDCPN